MCNVSSQPSRLFPPAHNGPSPQGTTSTIDKEGWFLLLNHRTLPWLLARIPGTPGASSRTAIPRRVRTAGSDIDVPPPPHESDQANSETRGGGREGEVLSNSSGCVSQTIGCERTIQGVGAEFPAAAFIDHGTFRRGCYQYCTHSAAAIKGHSARRAIQHSGAETLI